MTKLRVMILFESSLKPDKTQQCCMLGPRRIYLRALCATGPFAVLSRCRFYADFIPLVNPRTTYSAWPDEDDEASPHQAFLRKKKTKKIG